MRLIALIPLLCALAALILSLLCIFAGSRGGFLEEAHILTVRKERASTRVHVHRLLLDQLNTSEIGRFDIDTSNDSSSSPLSGLSDAIVETLEDVGGDVANGLADRLGLPDFYSAHLLTYCEGDYRPNGTAPDASKNVTRCSNRTALYSFDPARIIESELPAGITLDDLRWPEAVDDGLQTLRRAFRAMFIVYIVGIVSTGLALLTSAVGVFDAKMLNASINLMLAFVRTSISHVPVHLRC